MPGAARLNDIGSGHDCFPETPIIEGSPDVTINGQPAARKGDTVQFHGCPCPDKPHGMHSRVIAEGRPSLSMANPQPALVMGLVGGVIISGSSNVIIGDTPYKSPVQECAKQAVLNRSPLLALTPMLAMEPVFAIPCLRRAGRTDAGTEADPQTNIGQMSMYVAKPVGHAAPSSEKPVEVEQYAQAAKKKNRSPGLIQLSIKLKYSINFNRRCCQAPWLDPYFCF
ncbi:hypothetical protein BHG07_05225 [Brenneria salicis ATCC 15712 = DSM 30166]|uniref:Putative Zn-binding protein involved in type VI secretion n=1 Tax=Brenneria salicis ATCC 15712 = DSM 30166 TaxID=714314 RepID=A0A366I6J6_9GAMM|nr:putative Zn-binding protein involved in type VI secretion [Brenneria salicis ATCC 15712 = DSM 30166]RLM31435.1 hypothetical protein BHG07_05225 [Brenneria salicis ATCC 15712 = DSM 30166]